MSDAGDTTRTAIKTYVPAHQKAEWQQHAERLDMSQSEFVRTMVQAGRRGFAPVNEPGTATADEASSAPAGSDDFEARVLEALRESEYPTWEELVDLLTENVEARLDETLQSLQADNLVQYSGRHDGYALIEDD